MKGKLSLVLLFVLLAGSAYASSSQALAVYTFVCNGKKYGPCPQGANPNSLIQASDGNFYGTAVNSGTRQTGETVFGGTIFSLTPTGAFTLLHTFTAGANGKFTNGTAPISLTEGPDGKLYGLTVEGGNDFGNGFYGYGVVFRIDKTGSGFQVIHRFCSNNTKTYCSDGAFTAGALLVGADGNIYGVTSEGGGSTTCGSGCGEIFRVTPSTGAYKVVFSFDYLTDGGFPVGMIPAGDSFYGISSGGLFQYTPANGAFQVTAFPPVTGCPGLACGISTPFAFGPNGNFYGLYSVYLLPGDSGLYEVQPDGSNLQLLPTFTTTAGGGLQLLLASDGNFWFPQVGDMVAISPANGTLVQTLTPFNSSVPGANVIIQAKDGTLWGVGFGGTVTQSGHSAGGTIFSLNAGLRAK